MSIWRFSDHLTTVPPDCRLTLGEGNTPLIQSRHIGPALGIDRLFLKIECSNPTGSYKDRYAVCAVSKLYADKVPICLGTSSGNAGAALAAYCAVAGLRCLIAVVESAPTGKLRQMLDYGAEIVPIRGFGICPDTTRTIMSDLQHLAVELRTAVQISAYKYVPQGMVGVETISRELQEQLPDGFDHVFTPTAGGGLTLAVARGFQSMSIHPAVHSVQPRGNNTVAGPLREGANEARFCESTTGISGLQVADVIDGHETLHACRASGGTGYLVDDEQAFQMQRRLAREEGVFCEPAGAVALAGAAEAIRMGELPSDSTVVCLVTGSGFKVMDPQGSVSTKGLYPMMESVEQLSELLL